MKIPEDVLGVLERAVSTAKQLVLTGQLDRKLYTDTNKVLEAAGGVWNRKAKAHVFPEDAAELVQHMLYSGEVCSPKDDFEFFPTPPAVVDLLLAKAKLQPRMTVLEPSAGKGAIAFKVADVLSCSDVKCFEIVQAYADLFSKERILCLCTDFLTAPLPNVERFDRVIMNPPFANHADIKHVTRALEWLKPDGLLISVMSAGVAFRTDRLSKEFRESVQRRAGTIEALPDGSFKASGTDVRTVVVTIPAGAP